MLDAEVLISTLSLERASSVDADGQATTDDWQPVAGASAVPCRVSASTIGFGGRLRTVFQEKDTTVYGPVIFVNVPTAFDFVERDRITVDGVQYSLHFVYNPSMMDHHLELVTEVIK